jgi:hypothetical protein
MQLQTILLPSSQRTQAPILTFSPKSLAKSKMDASLRWHDGQILEAA